MNIGGFEISGIYCKDTITAMHLMPDSCVDLIVTDPPYLTGYKTNRRTDKEHEFTKVIDGDDNPELVKTYFAECYRICKPDTALYSFCDIDKIELFKAFIRGGGYTIRNVIVWIKNDHTAGDLYSAYGQKYECIIYANKGRAFIRGKRYSDVWEFPKVPPQSQIHQNQKPVELLMRAIEAHSDIDDIVFDGFAGSGSTCIAARKLRRKYLAFEINATKYEAAVNRIEKEFTQQSIFYE